MGFFSDNLIEEAVTNATSELIPQAQENIAANLDVCDLIKSKQVPPKEAMRCLKRRLQHHNPNLLDSCVKNTGHHFLVELASREFVDPLASMVRPQGGTNIEARMLAIGYLQVWALLFRDEPSLRYMFEVYEQLQREGIEFPPRPSVDAALVRTNAPPEWTDSPVCVRCRSAFTVTNRKHHCRSCGQTFCQACSDRNIELPDLGLTQPVRVCEACYAKRKGPRPLLHSEFDPVLSNPEPLKTVPVIADNRDEELEKAIQLSLVETKKYEAKLKEVATTEDEEAAMLAKAIAASLDDVPNAHSPGTSSSSRIPSQPYEPHKVVSPSGSTNEVRLNAIERENVQLFAQLMERLAEDGDGRVDDDLKRLAGEMMSLREKLSRNPSSSPDLKQTLETLGKALLIYDSIPQTGSSLKVAALDSNQMYREGLYAAPRPRLASGHPIPTTEFSPDSYRPMPMIPPQYPSASVTPMAPPPPQIPYYHMPFDAFGRPMQMPFGYSHEQQSYPIPPPTTMYHDPNFFSAADSHHRGGHFSKSSSESEDDEPLIQL